MHQERDASKVDEPSGEPPDKDLTFDPTMTDADEANIPAESAELAQDSSVIRV